MKNNYKTKILLVCLSVLLGSSLSLAQGGKSTFTGELKYSSENEGNRTRTDKLDNDYAGMSEFFKKFNVFNLPSEDIHKTMEQLLNNTTHSDIRLELGKEFKWDLTLEKFDIVAPNYVHSQTVNGKVVTTNDDSHFSYRGYANGNKENRVVLCVKGGYVNGFVMMDGEKHNIQSTQNFDKESDSQDIVVFTSKDAIEKEGAECNNDDGLTHDIVEKIKKEGALKRRAAGTCIELAVAYDPAFNQKFGGNGEDEIIARVALLSDWYTNDFNLDIEFKLVETHLEQNEEISPATKTTVCTGGNDLVDDITNWGNTGFVNDHDIGAYWVARNICGSSCGVVGCATISGVCRESRYNVNEDFFNSSERNTIIWAHEIGHNLGANHSTGDNLMSASLSGQSGANFGIATATRNAITSSRDNASCLQDACNETPPVPSFRSSSEFCSPIVNFEDRSSGAPTSRTWDFDNDGAVDATSENPQFTFPSAGTYPVKLTVTNNFGTNEITVDVVVEGPRPAKPDVTFPPGPACSPAEIDFTASGTAPFNWYSTESGGELLNTGSSYSPILTESADFYVTAGQSSVLTGGQLAPSQGGFFNSNDLRGLIFDVNKSSIIRSVVVDAEGGADRTIELLSAVDGTVLASKTINLVMGLQRIDLGFEVSPGQGYFLKVTGQVVALHRDNTGINYPIEIGDAITITGTNASVGGFYYYFYDWIVDVGCASERTEVSPVVEICSSLENNYVGVSLNVFPSPTTGLFTVELNSAIAQGARLDVKNSLGQVIMSDVTSSASGYKKVIDLSDQPKGVYLVSISANNGVVTEKIIVK